MDDNDIIDGLKIICKCRGIKKSVFLKLIATGLRSVAELQQATGAGTGDCHGKHCTPRLEALLHAATSRQHLHKPTHDDKQGKAE